MLIVCFSQYAKISDEQKEGHLLDEIDKFYNIDEETEGKCTTSEVYYLFCCTV